MYHLNQIQLINAPITEVFRFFENPENLETITPPWLGFTVLNSKPHDMRANAEFDYTITIFGLKLRWTSKITQYVPLHSFTDIQITGPYKTWIHKHTFKEMGNQTEVKDHIEYSCYGGLLSPVIYQFFVKNKLTNIFNYRQKQIDLIFNHNKSTNKT
jgi:ligand-binding SRPBCC domain-containing protein